MIEVVNLTKWFGPIKAVDNVGFKVQKGEVLGFLGPNGAGKSTTIRTIAGLLPPTKGTVLIAGKNFSDDPIGSKSKIGYMPESTPLYKEMTALEYLSFVAEIHGLSDIDKRVCEVIDIANLKSITNQLIETISKGYRSRLSFAAAIIHDPPILLLDEPTDGLDPNQKKEIRRLIKSLSREKAIIVSTHILEEVEAMCTRVIIISEGALVLDGTPEDLRNNSENTDKVVVCLRSEDKGNAQEVLSTDLISLGVRKEGFERFRLAGTSDLKAVNQKLDQANIHCEEIFYFDPPLEEAFGNITRTKE
jgi:ABC-2 type transport system ATP-binding protein